MKHDVHFAPHGCRYDLYMNSGYDPEVAAKHGIETHRLTPRFSKGKSTFQVRLKGVNYTGYISTRGDLIVRI